MAADGGGCNDGASASHANCGLSIAGVVTMGAGVGGVAVSVPILLGGAMVAWQARHPELPALTLDSPRHSTTVRLNLAPNGLVVSGAF